MLESFVRSYNLANEAFLYLTSINSSSCLSKAKIIIGDLDPACWWVPVEQIITFISKFRFLWWKCDTRYKECHDGRGQICDKSVSFVTKNGSLVAMVVSLPLNVDLILDLSNLLHPNQQVCTPTDLKWQNYLDETFFKIIPWLFFQK